MCIFVDYSEAVAQRERERVLFEACGGHPGVPDGPPGSLVVASCSLGPSSRRLLKLRCTSSLSLSKLAHSLALMDSTLTHSLSLMGMSLVGGSKSLVFVEGSTS